MLKSRQISSLVATAVTLLVLNCSSNTGGSSYKSDLTIFNHFPLEAVSPCGLVVRGDGLWLVDREYPGYIYQVSPQDGSTIAVYDAPSLKPTAIAYDGTSFWVSGEDTDSIYKLNPDFSVAETYPAPAEDISGLAFDSQGRLWSADRVTGCIYLHNPDLSVAESYPGTSNYDFYFGLTFSGDDLWADDYFQGLIYRFDSNMKIVEFHLAPWHNPTGLAIDGNTLWVVDVRLHSLIKCQKP
jgi:streptogramin lyase